MSIVIFDFDGTLTTRDTLRPLACFTARRQGARWKLPCFYALLCAYRAGLLSDRRLKESFLSLFFRDREAGEAEAMAEAFFDEQLDAMLNKEMMRTLAGHVAAGDEAYLLSANFDFFLAPLARRWKLKGILASATARAQGRLTGKLAALPLKGIEKVRKAEEVFGREAFPAITGYGDKEDEAFLKSIGKGIRV